MKNSGLVALILTALIFVNQSKAEDGVIALKRHVNDTNFCQVIFIMDGEKHEKDIDVRENEDIKTIFSQMFVPDSATNFLLIINFAWIENGTNRFPLKFKGTMSLG